MLRTHAFFVALALLAMPASAGVIVVDVTGGPGSQFTQIGFAVQAAAEGDVILVRPGSYNPVFLGDKSLTIQADGGASLVDPNFGGGGGLSIANLSAGKRIVLRGLTFVGQLDFGNGVFSTSMSAQNCAGTLWIDTCTSNSQVVVTNCANVVVTNSNLRGGDCIQPPLSPRPALDVTASNVFVHDTILIGGNGYNASTSLPIHPAGDGSAALRAVGGTAFLSNCATRGGAGGFGFLHPNAGCLSAGLGGPALHLASGNPAVTSVDCVLAVGNPGNTPGACSPPTGTVLPVDVDSGTWTPWAGTPGGFKASSPVREQQSLQLTFKDAVGSSVFVLLSANTSSALTPQFSGALQLAVPLLVTGLGAIPAGGTLNLPIVVPSLPAGVLGAVVFLQGATCPPTTPCTIGAPAVVVVLDSTL